MTLRKFLKLGHSGTFEAGVCAQALSSLCTLSAYYLEDNVISARVLLRILSEGYFLGDF